MLLVVDRVKELIAVDRSRWKKASEVEVKVNCESSFANYAKPANSSRASDVKAREGPLTDMLHHEVRTPMRKYSGPAAAIVTI